jgi:hypothetical protein
MNTFRAKKDTPSQFCFPNGFRGHDEGRGNDAGVDAGQLQGGDHAVPLVLQAGQSVTPLTSAQYYYY